MPPRRHPEPDLVSPIATDADWRANHVRLRDVADRHSGALQASLTAVHGRFGERAAALAQAHQGRDLSAEWAAYLLDAAQRCVLYWDVLRQRGDNYLAHEAAGTPPLLGFPYEIVLDGRTLERRSNYALVKLLPEDGRRPDPRRRPYLIIDPRAGQAAGIGASKAESQVGVALKAGHPVYFAIFFAHPEPGQTLADVCATHANFVRTVRGLHQDAPRPIVVGNCQGGWATALLAATNPDVTGPIVINGAPLAYWSGTRGRRHPMRYLGGLSGGAVPAMVLSDLGYGEFDGLNERWEALFDGLYRCPADPRDRVWSYGRNVWFELNAAETGEIEGASIGPVYPKLTDTRRPADTVQLAELNTASMGDHVMSHFWYLGAAPEVDVSRHHNASHYLFLDGHVERLAFEETFVLNKIDRWHPGRAQ